VTGPKLVGTIDLTPKGPRLAWLNAKTFRQGDGGSKNQSGHGFEHATANKDNQNPYLGGDGKWYYFDETYQSCETGFVTREQAEIALGDYCTWLNSPENEPQAEPMPVSIGGISEILGLSTDNADPLSR
jgi:hypothetical protein